MTYAKVENKTITVYPYSDSHIRRDNPDISFPSEMTEEIRNEYGAFPVTDIAPEYDSRKQYVERKPLNEWTFSNGKVTVGYNVKNRTIEERKQILIDALKQKRWEVETGGVTVPINGEDVLVSTARGDDRTNLHIMMTTIVGGMRQDGATFNFADSKPRSVSNADMLMAITAALSHVQAAFDREAEITTEINSANTHAKLDLALDKIEEVW